MKLLSKAVVLVFLLGAIAACNAYAQDPDNSVVIGVPKFSTVTNGPDVTNLGNLNVHWEFPIISKPGRGLPYELALTFDNSVWKNDGRSWSPMGAMGWAVQSTLPNGSSRSTHTQELCGGTGFNRQYTDRWTNWRYIDSSNITHAFANAFFEFNDCTSQRSTSGPVAATDGSGYILVPLAGEGAISTPSGLVLRASGQVVGITDSNGNQLIGNQGDTLGMNVVTITRPVPTGVPPFAPATYVYTDSNGAQQTVTVNYSSYNLQTNFGCPNVAEYNVPGVSFPLVSSIVYPDGRTYSFTYEPTPGNPAGVTGRLGSVTLPTGGVIKYSYPGPNDGINCAMTDSSTIGLARQTPDGTTTYTRTNISGTEWKTSVTYPPDSLTGQQNQTDLYFQDVQVLVQGQPYPFNQFFETKRQIFQGSDQGSPLQTVHTCYNGSAPDCTTTAITLPITQTTELTQLASGQQRQTVTFRNAAGLVTETDEYDYGNNAPGALLKKTLTQYLLRNGNIVNRPTVVTVQDGAGNQIAQTQYLYDEMAPPVLSNVPQHIPGAGATGLNATTVKHWVNTTNTFLTTKNGYDDTGNLISTTDPLGNTTSFSYSDNFADGVSRNSLAYVTQTTLPDTNSPNLAHHVTSAKYDANTGRKVSAIDQNGNETDSTYDLMLRPLTVTLPADSSGNRPKTTLIYPDPNTITVQKTITSGITDSETGKLDGLGRTIQTQHAVPGGPAKVDATYDSMGRLLTVSNPYFSTTDPTYGIKRTQYDALGRVTQVTKQDGSISTVSYSGNCTTATDEAGKARKTCSNGLGQLTEVDEPAGGSPASTASGSLTISGALQTKPATNGTPGTGLVTFSGAEQSKSGTAATTATGSVTITGAEGSVTTPGDRYCNVYNDNGDCVDWEINPGTTVYDSGTVAITVNGHSDSTSYGSASTATSIASSLASAINGDGGAFVNASAVNGVLSLTARQTGSGGNYSWTIAFSSSDPGDFGAGGSFGGSPTSGALSGGANAGPLVYDHGTCTVTVNGTSYSKNFGQGDTTSTIGSGLASTITAGSLASATASGATISLTAKTSGVSTNYSLSRSCSYDSSNFSSPSFTAGASGSSLTGGTNGSPAATDAGTVTMSIAGYSATANYGNGTGQDSTATAVSSDLVSKIQAQLPASNPPFTISAGGATINVNWSSVGAAGNVALSTTSTTSQASYFSKPSFASCSITSSPQNCNTTLSGGADLVPPSLNTPYVTLYSSDPLGNLLRVDQKGSAPSDSTQWRTRLFTYDSLSRLLTARNPESGTISYTYDADGNMLQKTSPQANQPPGSTATQTISYCYDALNRVTGKAYTAQSCPLSSPVVTYSYDQGTNAIGHMISLSDQAGSGSYNYDALGRMTSEHRTIAGVSKTMSYDYNLDGSIKTVHYPSGAAVTYTPDSAGRMLSAIDSGNGVNYATGATYGPDSALTGFVSGNNGTFTGITNSFSYNKRFQPINMSASTQSQTVFSIGYDFHLGNGDNGNVWGITNYKDNSRNETFTYDQLNRLTSAQNAGTDCTQSTVNGKTKFWGNSYGYDAWGNLLSKSVTKCSAENLSATALVNNQLSPYGYDAAGNTTKDNLGQSYNFDAENRITGAAGFTYTYDDEGNRVEKSTGSTGTLYWYMTPGVVGESDLAGNLKTEYVFFGGKRVARRDLPAGTVSYYFSDYLKTASVVTDNQGNIQDESDFYPWGGELQLTHTLDNHYLFTGHERDGESGLDYFGARYYSNSLGRFLTPDWAAKAAAVPYAELADPQSLNLYSYVRNRPTVMVDPDGHLETTVTNPDGSKTTTHDDGSQTTVKEEVQPGGSSVTDKNGTTTTITYTLTSTTERDADGNVTSTKDVTIQNTKVTDKDENGKTRTLSDKNELVSSGTRSPNDLKPSPQSALAKAKARKPSDDFDLLPFVGSPAKHLLQWLGDPTWGDVFKPDPPSDFGYACAKAGVCAVPPQ